MKDEYSELWVVEGRKPVLWTMPIYVAWKDTSEGIVMCALAQLNGLQTMTFKNHMKDFGREFNGGWIVFRHELARTAKPVVAGCDPECLFSWQLPRIQDLPQHQTQERIERNDFLDSLDQSREVPLDRAQLEYVWRKFCEHIGEWLINREKPVDFYLFTLHASPYRSNWKELLRDQITDQASRSMFHKKKTRFNLKAMLLQPRLLAQHPGRRICLRRIEVEHKKSWWKQLFKVETARLNRLSPSVYANEFLNFINRCLDRSLRLFTSYMAEDRTPAPVARKGEHSGDFKFVPEPYSNELPETLMGYSSVAPPPLAWASQHKVLGWQKTLLAENGGVPALPDISLQTENVRKQIVHVPKPTNGADGADGVPVRDAAESSDAK